MADTLADILAKAGTQQTALDRRQRMADQLLASGSRAGNPLIAFLTNAVGSYQMADIADEQKKREEEMEKQAENQTPPLFQGTSMDAQTYNILASGDPTSTAYKIAYNIAAQPKTQVGPDGTIITVKPDLSAFPKPGGSRDSGGNFTTPPIAPSPPAPSYNPAGTPPIAPIPNDGRLTTNIDGTEIVSIPGNKPSSADKSTLKEVESNATVIKNELKKFENAVDAAKDEDFLSAASGGLTEGGQKLVGTWTTTALSAKGKALLDLGVLNGPDLVVIQGMLPNPGTVKGGLASKAAYKQAVKNVESFIDGKVEAYKLTYGQQPIVPTGAELNAPPPPGFVPPELTPVKRKKYNPATGKIE